MMGFKISYKGQIPPAMRKRDWNKLIKFTFRKLGEFWPSKMRPKHFTKAGAKEYDYTPRAGEDLPFGTRAFWRSYTGQKLRKYGHTLPLVYSGLSMEQTHRRDIRATSKGVRIVMHAPALNFRHPKSEVDMRAEMTRVSGREETQIMEKADVELNRGLRGFRKAKTRQIRAM